MFYVYDMLLANQDLSGHNLFMGLTLSMTNLNLQYITLQMYCPELPNNPTFHSLRVTVSFVITNYEVLTQFAEC